MGKQDVGVRVEGSRGQWRDWKKASQGEDEMGAI